MSGKGWLGVGIGAAAVAVLAWFAIHEITDSPEGKPLDPNPSSSFKLVAMGDSYISGEGARHYFPGTDEPDGQRNMCHRAATAYPYLLAEQLDASLTFIACSGAVTQDITGENAAGQKVPGQYPRSGDVIGAKPQIEELLKVADPSVVLISIGGNDSGFAEIGVDCASPLHSDCRGLASQWLHRLDTKVYPALVRTYSLVREDAHGAPVFALTYPNPVGPKFCDDLLGLNAAEMAFLREVFVGRLNEIVTAAATAAGVRTIDLTNALAGYRFCEKPLGQTAINFIDVHRTSGVPIDVTKLGGIFHGSLHPNPLGHELIDKVVLPQVEAARDRTLPPAPAPHPDAPPPPFVPSEIGSPDLARPFPEGTECHGSELTAISQLAAEPSQKQISLAELKPSSTVCFRTYRAEWEAKPVGKDGAVRVPIDVSSTGVGSINEILVQDATGAWKEFVVSRLSSAEGGF
jgi:lysophospholipase L1-like esterase